MGYSPLAIFVMNRNYERAKKKYDDTIKAIIRQEFLHDLVMDELIDFFEERSLIV